jgi:uncharacterized membrane protein YczE
MTGVARLGLSIRVARTLVEFTVLAVGWLLGGTVGIGTIVFAVSSARLTRLFVKMWRPAA